VAEVFRRHRVEGIPQRQVAEEFGVSLSTVESDLRKAYAALAAFKERHDEA
jgi:RNA polymerase sigma-70 factor (ECF subfamily)